MRNTPTSLDIIFVDDRSQVLNIAPHTTPCPTSCILPPGPLNLWLRPRPGSPTGLASARALHALEAAAVGHDFRHAPCADMDDPRRRCDGGLAVPSPAGSADKPYFIGVNYGPFHQEGQSPHAAAELPPAQILRDLGIIHAAGFRHIRTFGLDNG